MFVRKFRMGILFFLIGMVGSWAFAEEKGPMGEYVSREEYDSLKKRFETLQAQVEDLVHKKTEPEAKATAKAEVQVAKADETSGDEEELSYLDSEVERLSGLIAANRSGSTKYLLTGYGYADYTYPEKGDSTFNAAFNPIFLWKVNDKFLFTAEVEFELEDGSTATSLEIAEIHYFVNDWLTIRAGKFLTPLSTFKEHHHPAWINKLPDQPLFAEGDAQLVPESSLGVQLTGAFNVMCRRLNYAFWVSNGPKLITDAGSAGQLDFNNFPDINDSKAIGGRLGFFPIPELELAYSILWGKVGADGTAFDGIDALLQDVSLSFVKHFEKIKGKLELRGEYVWSIVGHSSAYGGGINIPDNKRAGAYGLCV